jgi:hypothetical protein
MAESVINSVLCHLVIWLNLNLLSDYSGYSMAELKFKKRMPYFEFAFRLVLNTVK